MCTGSSRRWDKVNRHARASTEGVRAAYRTPARRISGRKPDRWLLLRQSSGMAGCDVWCAGFIERVNNYRAITGMGFAFLNIPRSYYGRLRVVDLTNAGISEATANAVEEALQAAGLVSKTGIVEMSIDNAAIQAALSGLKGAAKAEAGKQAETVNTIVKRGRYANMYNLLRDTLSENTYIQIVQNKILVDVQGGDILYQIFTQSIMQVTSHAPWLSAARASAGAQRVMLAA